nr:hypothetical protein Iba_chr13aCG9300 [Ipomoea batatas]
MYPYLDFFNEPETEGMEFLNNASAEDEDLRSHLNTCMGTNQAHPKESQQQDFVNIINEVPTYPTMPPQMPYHYPVNPMGLPDPNYHWNILWKDLQNGRIILFVQRFSQRGINLLQHRVPTSNMRPLPVRPGQVLTDLLVNKRPKKRVGRGLVFTKKGSKACMVDDLFSDLCRLFLRCCSLCLDHSHSTLELLNFVFQLFDSSIFRYYRFFQRINFLLNQVFGRFSPAEEVGCQVRDLSKQEISYRAGRTKLGTLEARTLDSLPEQCQEGDGEEVEGASVETGSVDASGAFSWAGSPAISSFRDVVDCA